MSYAGSQEADADVDWSETKKRKVQRACDVCRRRKIRCDGPMSSHRAAKCAHCQENRFDCTYIEEARRKGPPKGYVLMLEQRCRRLERLVQQLSPGLDADSITGPPMNQESFELNEYRDRLAMLDIPPFPRFKPVSVPASCSPNAPVDSRTSQSPRIRAPLSQSTAGTSAFLDRRPSVLFERVGGSGSVGVGGGSGGGQQEQLERAESHVRNTTMMNIHKTFGKADVRWEFYGRAATHNMMHAINERKFHDLSGSSFARELGRTKRVNVWKTPEWELIVANQGQRPVDYSIWPEDDAAMVLIDAYFTCVNSLLPLLNRVMFRQRYLSRLYMDDYEFAKVCLMVFANGARYVRDVRAQWGDDRDTLSGGDNGKNATKAKADSHDMRLSSGWKYVGAVMKTGRSLRQRPTLYSLQTAVLMCAFMRGSSDPHLTWSLAGIGLRSTQEIGVHVDAVAEGVSTEDRILLNRAFWCLYHFDRSTSVLLGRSVALPDYEISASLPAVVDDDDQYWDTGNLAHDDDDDDDGDGEDGRRRPDYTGRLSQIASFVQLIKLDRIISAALVTVPARNSSNSSNNGDIPAMISQLDASLVAWMDAVPRELGWDRGCVDDDLFVLTAHLHARYHWARIFIHCAASYQHGSGQSTSPGNPSLDTCLDAARSIFDIAAAMLAHERLFGSQSARSIDFAFIDYAWLSVSVTVMCVHTGKIPLEQVDEVMDGVHKCVAAVQQMERSSRSAAQIADILITVSATPTQQQLQQQQQQQQQQQHDLRTESPLPLIEPNGDCVLLPFDEPAATHHLPAVNFLDDVTATPLTLSNMLFPSSFGTGLFHGGSLANWSGHVPDMDQSGLAGGNGASRPNDSSIWDQLLVNFT